MRHTFHVDFFMLIHGTTLPLEDAHPVLQPKSEKYFRYYSLGQERLARIIGEGVSLKNPSFETLVAKRG